MSSGPGTRRGGTASTRTNEEVKRGSGYFAEPGLVVIPTVDREHMERAAAQLAASGYFASLRPIEGLPTLHAPDST